MACDCNLSLSTLPDRDSIQLHLVDRPSSPDPACARICSFVGSSVIEATRGWWENLTPSQQDAALAHELGHMVPTGDGNAVGGQPCESCADRVAGALMRRWGYSRTGTVSAFQSLGIVSRASAPRDAAAGWSMSLDGEDPITNDDVLNEIKADGRRNFWLAVVLFIAGVAVTVGVKK